MDDIARYNQMQDLYDPRRIYADNQTQTRVQAKPAKKKKNFWLDQISTAGGILGGIGGSFVAPVAGTAAGAGAGAALGETLENALMGESLTKNVAKEGALGAVFGAGPIKLLKGGAALATGKGVQAASQAAMTPLRQTAGKAVTGAADDLAVKTFRLNPSQLRNFQSKFGEDAGQVIRKYGFQNADDIAVKGIEPLQQQFDEAIGGIAGVTKDSLQKNLMKRAAALSKSGPSDSRALGKQLETEIGTLLKGKGDVLDPKELNVIRRQFDDLVNYTEKVANPSRYGVNKRMADGIRETLQQADQTGGLKDLGRELQKLRQLSDAAGKQTQLGRGSLPLSLPALLGGGVGGAAAGLPGAAVTTAGTMVANSPAGRKATLKGAETLAGALTRSGARAAGQSPKGIAGRQIAQNLLIPRQAGDNSLEAAFTQDLPNSSQATPMTTPNMNSPMSSNMGEQYQMGGNNASPYSRQNLMADVQRDPANAEDYFKLYQMYDEVFSPKQEQEKPLNQGQQERADLIQALNNTEGLMAGGSINYGPVGSRIEGIKSMFNAADPETLAFKNTVSGLRAAITKARAGASLTPGELKMLAQYTPSDSDSEQVVRSKLQQLRSLYGYQAPKGGGSSLEDALMGAQGAY